MLLGKGYDSNYLEVDSDIPTSEGVSLSPTILDNYPIFFLFQGRFLEKVEVTETYIKSKKQKPFSQGLKVH